MATMRAEAVDMIYSLTESQVENVVSYLKKIIEKDSQKHKEEEQLERDMAYKRLNTWIEEHKNFWGDNFDWRKEYIKGLKEKYGIAD